MDSYCDDDACANYGGPAAGCPAPHDGEEPAAPAMSADMIRNAGVFMYGTDFARLPRRFAVTAGRGQLAMYLQWLRATAAEAVASVRAAPARLPAGELAAFKAAALASNEAAPCGEITSGTW